MSGWVRKVRGVFGLSAIGGVLGGLFGAARFGVLALLGAGTVSVEMLVQGVLAYGAFAGIATGGVGLLLATAGSKLSLEELSPIRAGLVGALLGGIAPVLFVLGTFSGGLGTPALLSIALRFGLLGGILGGGLVAVAKRADRTLPSGEDDGLLLRGE